MFRRSLDELKSPRALVITAMLIALNLAMDLMGLKIYLTPELRVSVGFVCNASVAMLYGPTVGMMTGFSTDVLGFLLSPNNNAGYFPGYTITAIVVERKISTGMKEQYLSSTSLARYSFANSRLSSFRNSVISLPTVVLFPSCISYSVPP